MKRVVTTVVFALAGCALAASPVFAQGFSPALAATPAASQELPQAVKAAIPPQATRPTVAPTPMPRPGEPSQERPTPAVANATAFDDIPNVRVDVTITYQVGQGAPVKRSASLVVASGNESGSLRSGNQVPVPSTTFMPMPAPARADSNSVTPTAASTPMTSFNYRSVGLNVDARRVRVAGNRSKMDLSVEFSAVDEKATDPGKGPSYPSFPTFSQNLSVILENGKPVVIAQTSDVVENVERKQSIEVKATILK